VVTPAARRLAVGILIAHGLSERRSCTLARLSRSVYRYRAHPRDDRALRARLSELAEMYPRYGCALLHALLRREGLAVNRKRTQRVYRALGLQVRRRGRGKLQRPRMPLAVPTGPRQRWSMDFVSDQFITGRRFRVLSVLDDHTRECLGQLADVSLGGQRVAQFLRELGDAHGLPRGIVCDNGPEFTSKALLEWQQSSGVALHFIQPGKPMQNGIVESFNGRFREGCLNQLWFRDLTEARAAIAAWRQHYNAERPHSALGYLPPEVFKATLE
jgi:putative transposase